MVFGKKTPEILSHQLCELSVHEAGQACGVLQGTQHATSAGTLTEQDGIKHKAGAEFVLESLTGTQAPSGSHSTLLFVRTNPPSSFCLLLHTLKTNGRVLYCPIVWYRNGLCTPFTGGKKTGFNPCFCGLNSGWDLSQSLKWSLVCVEHTPDLQHLQAVPHCTVPSRCSCLTADLFPFTRMLPKTSPTAGLTKKSTEDNAVAVFPYHWEKVQHQLF